MPIGVVHYPHLLAPCRNDVWVEYLCTNYRTGETAVAGTFIGRVATPVPGSTITIVLPGGEVVTLTAVAGAPDGSGSQYTIGSMHQLAQALNNNVAFSALYTATPMSGSAEVWIGARWPWVTLPPSMTLGAAYQQHDAQGNTDHVYAANYSARSRLWVEQDWLSNTWHPVEQNEHYPDADQHARENIAPLLLPFLGYDWPAYGQALPMRSLAPLRRYKLQAWERYGTPASDQVATTLAVRVAWFAGQRHRDTPSQPFWEFTLGNTDVPTPWLTYRGRQGRHEVSPGQQHVLGWYRNTARLSSTLMRLRATVHYTDGTSASTDTVSDAGTPWERGEICLFPAGFRTLGLDALQPAKVPYKYILQLYSYTGASAGVAASEAHTCWLLEEEASELHIEYVSSLGVVESMRCVGAWEEALAAKYAQVQRLRRVANGVLPPSATSDARHLLASAVPSLQVSTGYCDEAEHHALCDILFSPEVRLVDHANQRHIPLVLGDGSHAVSRRGAGTDEHLYALNLQFTLGDPEQAWGDRAAMPMATAPAIGGPAEGGGGDEGG